MVIIEPEKRKNRTPVEESHSGMGRDARRRVSRG